MPTLHSHTHYQAAQATAQTQAWQRVCLSQLSTEPTEKRSNKKEARCPNMRLASCGVQWLNSSSVFQLNFCAENAPLRKAENR